MQIFYLRYSFHPPFSDSEEIGADYGSVYRLIQNAAIACSDFFRNLTTMAGFLQLKQ